MNKTKNDPHGLTTNKKKKELHKQTHTSVLLFQIFYWTDCIFMNFWNVKARGNEYIHAAQSLRYAEDYTYRPTE